MLTNAQNQDTDTCQPVPIDDLQDDYHLAGICGVAVQNAHYTTAKTRYDAQAPKFDYYHYKPSIGTDGRFCVCYQPSDSYQTSFGLTDEQEQWIETRENEMNQNNNNAENVYYSRVDGHDLSEEETNAVDLRDSNVVYLSSNDFQDGTLRIKKSGTYIITEDIEFDFGKDYDYWPQSSQADEYPGAQQFRDPYSFGFFAGITVEADYVTIDLNGHELKQSIEFYFNQRWFAIIELGNQQFLPGNLCLCLCFLSLFDVVRVYHNTVVARK